MDADIAYAWTSDDGQDSQPIGVSIGCRCRHELVRPFSARLSEIFQQRSYSHYIIVYIAEKDIYIQPPRHLALPNHYDFARSEVSLSLGQSESCLEMAIKVFGP